MSVTATKKHILSALEQMHLYGAIKSWAEPIPGSPTWTVWVGNDGSLRRLTGREILAMNTGVCAALSAVKDGRSVMHNGIYLRAEMVPASADPQ